MLTQHFSQAYLLLFLNKDKIYDLFQKLRMRS